MIIKGYDESRAVHLLQGSIDTHVHSAPDVIPRKMDDLALARDAAKTGMRGLILKCHVAPTEGRANLVQQMVPEVHVRGGIVLNWNVGGLNPEAVRVSARLGAKIVWMPTVSAANHVQGAGRSSFLDSLGGGMKGEGLTVYDGRGKLKIGLDEILELIKEYDLILATGHLAPTESIRLINEALRFGIKKILVNHPEGHTTHYSLEEQKGLAMKGVFFERCWVVTTNLAGEQFRIPPEEIAAAIRKIGPNSTVMATDHGQVSNPPPAAGMQNYIAAMLRCGITEQEIELMAKRNPAQLLDI